VAISRRRPSRREEKKGRREGRGRANKREREIGKEKRKSAEISRIRRKNIGRRVWNLEWR